MITKDITKDEAIIIRAMYLVDPEEFSEYKDERIYGWTAFDESHEIIDITHMSDKDVVELFYSLVGTVDE